MTLAPLHMPVPAPGHNSGDAAAAYDTIADDLARQGWCVLRDFFPAALLADLQSRMAQLEAQDALTPAGVGRGSGNIENRAIRRDRTLWLERKDPVEAALLQQMETLRCELNRRLMLGLFFYEAHFARYGSGAFYKRHRDSFRGRRNRIISTVLYLNHDWQPEDGGLLAMYADDETSIPFVTIAPELGTFVLFLSEEIPHEVLPANRPRASIAGWFRCNDKTEAPALQAPTATGPTLT